MFIKLKKTYEYFSRQHHEKQQHQKAEWNEKKIQTVKIAKI